MKRFTPVVFLLFFLPTLSMSQDRSNGGGYIRGADRDEGADSQSGKICRYELLEAGVERVGLEIMARTIGCLAGMTCELSNKLQSHLPSVLTQKFGT
jgi:hypothetical protein